MSNAPIQSFPPATSESLANVNRPLPDSQNNSASGATTEVTTRASGSAPLQDTSTNKVVVSSYELPEDVVEVRESSKQNPTILLARDTTAHAPSPGWMEVDKDALRARITSMPRRDELVQIQMNEQLIVELYSK